MHFLINKRTFLNEHMAHLFRSRFLAFAHPGRYHKIVQRGKPRQRRFNSQTQTYGTLAPGSHSIDNKMTSDSYKGSTKRTRCTQAAYKQVSAITILLVTKCLKIVFTAHINCFVSYMKLGCSVKQF